MALTKEQIKELKQQLTDQIQHLTGDEKKQMQKEIEEMSAENLEVMRKQQQNSGQTHGDVFRMIISGKIPAKIIEENSGAMAALEIKPVSKGHVIVIPKTPVTDPKDLSDSTYALAKKLSEEIPKKLSVNETKVQTQFNFGEVVINIIPIYDKPLDIYSERYSASNEELDEVYKILKTIPKPKVIKQEPKKQSKVIKLQRRVP